MLRNSKKVKTNAEQNKNNIIEVINKKKSLLFYKFF